MSYVGPATAQGRYVVRDVAVVDTLDGTVRGGQDLEVADGTVAAITPTGGATDLPVVDGFGAYVVPGYVDSHAHALNSLSAVPASYALMLANGVVGFRQMSGSAALLDARRAGQLPTPSGAPELLALPGDLLTPLNSAAPEAAAAQVRAQAERGADFVKAGMMSRDAFLAALAEAARVGIPLSGHLPGDVSPREAALGGMRCIEHLGPGATMFASTSDREAEIRSHPPRTLPLPSLRLPGMNRVLTLVLNRIVVNPTVTMGPTDAVDLEIADSSFDEERAAALAADFVAHETWNCPTLIRSHTQQFADTAGHTADPRLRYVDPAEVRRWRGSATRFGKLPQATREALRAHWPAQLRLTKVLADAGVGLLAGTDSNGAGWVVPGFALHDELAHLAAAGLTPFQVLRSATAAPARFFGRENVAGRVAPGYHADLVLLAADPTADSSALSRITAVVRAGDLWSRADLDATLERLAATPTAR